MGETKHETYSLKPATGNWQVNPADRNVEQVLTFIKKFDPTPIDQAAVAYRDAHKAVADAQEAIKNEAYNLAKVWEGKASVEAQQALGVLYVTLGELADKLNKMAHPLSEFGKVVRGHQGFLNDDWKGFLLPAWHYQGLLNGGSWNDDIPDYYGAYTGYYNNKGERVDGNHGKWGTPNNLAGQHLELFGQDLRHIFDKMPNNLNEDLRDIKPPTGPGPQLPPVTYPFDQTGAGNGMPVSYNGDGLTGYKPGGLDTDNPSLGTLDPDQPGQTDPHYPGTGNPGDPTTGSQDPNIPGGVGGQNPGGSTTQNPGTGANPTSLQDYSPTNGYSSPTGNIPTGNPTTHGTHNPSGHVPGTTGGPGGGGLYGGGAVPTGGPGAKAVRTGTGMPFMPMGAMGGGAGAEQSRDRESTTWLHEDDDVWGGDADGAVNSKIG